MTDVDRTVVANNDDCYTRSTNIYFLNYLYMTHPSYTYHKYIRFKNITIDQGMEITAAYFRLRAYNTADTGDTQRIWGLDEVNTAIFTTQGDADGRPLTGEYVDWQPGSWIANAWYTSDSLTAIVQEIINRGDWVSGSSIGFRFDNTVRGSGGRQARSKDGGSPPTLYIRYTPSNPQAASGAITFTGTFFKKTKLSKAGGITPVGVPYKETSTVKAGTFTSAGNLIAGLGGQLVGAFTASGVLIRKVYRTLVGAFTSSGAVCRSRHLEGVLASAGETTTRVLRGAGADYEYRINTEVADMDNVEALLGIAPAGVRFRYNSIVQQSGIGVSGGSGFPQCEWPFDYLSWASLAVMLAFLGGDESVGLYINTRRPDNTYGLYSAIMHRPHVPGEATQIIGGWRNVTFRFTRLESV